MLEKINALCLVLSLVSLNTALADYRVELTNNGFYTDDASLFTVTRQLSLLDDPTQPTIDNPIGHSDFVYEPTAAVLWQLPDNFGKTTFFAKAGGYVFAQNTDFTHAAFQTAINHQFDTDTTISAMYRFIPDRFLGQNSVEQEIGNPVEGKETLTSNIWSIHVEQKLTDWLEMHILGRYGIRDYDAVFKHRSIDLWTLGTHFSVKLGEDTELFFGYHFENGNARNLRSIELNDDVSYHTHYVSIEIETELTEKLKLAFDFDFEKNSFTTQNRQDEHFANPEAVYLGGVQLSYAVNESSSITLGLQHGSRKKKNEIKGFDNTNVWLGYAYNF